MSHRYSLRSTDKMQSDTEQEKTDEAVTGDVTKDLAVIVEKLLKSNQRDTDVLLQGILSSVKPSANTNVGVKPDYFSGLPTEEPRAWIEAFMAWVKMNNWTDGETVANAMRLLLKSSAITWFNSVPSEDKKNTKQLVASFKAHFVDAVPVWLLDQQLFSRTMIPGESLEAFIADIDAKCRRLDKPEKDKISILVRGLTPSLRPTSYPTTARYLAEGSSFCPACPGSRHM